MSKKAKADKIVELSFEGELTIPKVAELKVQLVKALEKSGGMSLNLKNVTRADLTFLQLLCSAHRSAYKAGKVMMLTDVSEAVDSEVIAAGFIRDNMSCGQNCSDSCLWLESE